LPHVSKRAGREVSPKHLECTINPSFYIKNIYSSDIFSQKTGIMQLFGVCIKHKLRGILQDAFQDEQFVVSDHDYAQYEMGNNFTKLFIARFDKLIEHYLVFEESLCQLQSILFLLSILEKLNREQFQPVDGLCVGVYCQGVGTLPRKQALQSGLP
jgi:hypothetical protein